MKKLSARDIIAATRYWMLPVSTMPVIVTVAFLYSKGMVCLNWEMIADVVLCIIGVVVLHSAENLLCDYYDCKSEDCREGAYRNPKFEPKAYLLLSMMFFSVGCLIGVYLVMRSGYGLLAIGALSILLSVMYSYLRSKALGDLDVFVVSSVLIMLGTAYVMTDAIYCDVLILALPVGVINVSVIHADNISGIESERRSWGRTFAMAIGMEASIHLYRLYMILPFLALAVTVMLGYLHPLVLISLLAAVPAYKNIRKSKRFETIGVEAVKGLDHASARLQLIFSVLLSIGLVIASLQ